MMTWIAPALIAIAVAAALLRSLRSKESAGEVSASESDLAVYRDQLKEVDRDLARGVLTESEAEAVRVEVSRRLLEADRRSLSDETHGTNANSVLAAGLIGVTIAASFLLYATLGAPGAADLPMNERLAQIEAVASTRVSQAEAEERARAFLPEPSEPDARLAELMEKLRATVAERPNDIQGLSLLAENEARLGNFTAAREAQEQLIVAHGNDVPLIERLALLDIMVYAAGGFVSPEAEAVIRDALSQSPENPPARYYAGLMYAQNGRPDRAFPIWRRLLETSTPDAPWVPVIRDEISEIAAAAGVQYSPPAMRGPTQDDIAAAEEMDADDRMEMIRGMVEGLADRLASDGGPPEEWARLITALGVLGETDRARMIADEAKQVFAASSGALSMIDEALSGLPE